MALARGRPGSSAVTSPAIQTRQGIDIAGKAGDPVRAAADGTVVYSGNGLIGYGELIIVKHNPAFLSAYGHNRKRLVKEGDQVKAGQTIAEMGSSSASRDELHFEIRKNGKPVESARLPAAALSHAIRCTRARGAKLCSVSAPDSRRSATPRPTKSSS